jgi:hypothetical protein
MAMLPQPEVDDDDTIEIELTAEEMRGLSRAANEAQPPKTVPPARMRRVRLWPVAMALAVLGIAAAIIWRPAPHRVAQPVAPLPAMMITPPPASAPAAPAVPAPPPAPPVRVRNPFDATEVFEFPAGTTKAEARQKIADVLLQRAVDRRSQGVQERRRARRRRAQED